MRIALYSSKRERCGISTYTAQLEKAFIALGHEVQYFSSFDPYVEVFARIIAWKPDVIHVQHEMSIMPQDSELHGYLSQVKTTCGTRIAVTFHTDSEAAINSWYQSFPKGTLVILHRPSKGMRDAKIVPMPCTMLDPLPDRFQMREKYHFPKDAFIISTVGFMIPWKQHPELIGMIAPWIMRKPAMLQVIASAHFNPTLKAYADVCQKQISDVAGRMEGRLHHIVNYPSDEEVVERLAASDLGYVWCPFDTGSSSAAGAQFTTARCPLVASDSSHYSNLGKGLVYAPKNDMTAFVEMVIKVSSNPEFLWHLKTAQEATYQERNYLQTAKIHLMYYGDLSWKTQRS